MHVLLKNNANNDKDNNNVKKEVYTRYTSCVT